MATTKSRNAARRGTQQRTKQIKRAAVVAVAAAVLLGCAASINQWINVLTQQGII
jgi:hypothetical protein